MIKATAEGQGYYRVFVNNIEKSKHLAEREALEAAAKLKRLDPFLAVYYTHDYRVRIDLVSHPVVVVPPPTPVPTPTPIPAGRIKASDFELLGGWRIPQEFARGGLAIDWTTRRVFTLGHAQANEMHEYALPNSRGQGSHVNDWPILQRVATHEPFWWGNIAGIKVENGVVWVSAKIYYDTAPGLLTLYGKNLTTGEILSKPTTLSQPAFGGGFVKGHAEPLLGCGGYESGQSSVAGPTCAKEDGTILLNQAHHGTMDWDSRTPRNDNYSVNGDSWVGLSPRNGEGRWCSDRVYAGGVWKPNGLCYWPILGTGFLDYAHQSECFQIGEARESCLYTYDPLTFDNVAFETWSHGEVHGQEVDTDGNVYLLTRNAWISGMYMVDSAIKIFKVN